MMKSQMEIWKTIDGFEDYEISNCGKVRNRITGKELSTKHPDKIHGYCRVYIKTKRGYVTKTVHRLVADAFIPNPENKEQVHHKNRDKTDNSVENLEWVTPEEHSKLDARPRAETAYFFNREKRKKMANNVLSKCDIV